MKILKATTHARILHLPAETLESKVIRHPLCLVSDDKAEGEFGILEDGAPTCKDCIGIALEMIRTAVERVESSKKDRVEYQRAVSYLSRLRERRFQGIEKAYFDSVVGGQNVAQPVR